MLIREPETGYGALPEALTGKPAVQLLQFGTCGQGYGDAQTAFGPASAGTLARQSQNTNTKLRELAASVVASARRPTGAG
jgi:hypothetical protein